MVMIQRKGSDMSGDALAVTTVAVAIKGSAGDSNVGGHGSRRAVHWAFENLLHSADRFVLVHVMRPVTSIPTPTGERMPVEGLDENVVAMYTRDIRKERAQVFAPLKKLCKNSKVETLLLEHDDPAKALLSYISEADVKTLVMGSFTSNLFTRKAKGAEIPLNVLRYAPEKCEVYVVCKDKIISKSVDYLLTGSSSSSHTSPQELCQESSTSSKMRKSHPEEVVGKRIDSLSLGPRHCLSNKETSSSPMVVVDEACKEAGSRINRVKSEMSAPPGAATIEKTPRDSVVSQHSYTISQSFTDMYSSTRGGVDERNHTNANKDTATIKQSKSVSPAKSQKADVMAEVECLRTEVRNTVAMYKKACEELVHKQNKVQLLSAECLEEAKRVTAAVEKKKMLKKAAAEERQRHLRAAKEVEEAKSLLAKEFCERQIAELNALRQSIEKKKIIDQLFLRDRRYRRYTRDEIEAATGNFSQSKVIGEGGYGKVYRCNLDHTPVAVKVLRPNAVEKKEEFLKEVSVLSQLHHPHVVLLLGACPEKGSLVYEYMENGSLEDYILNRKGKPPLPWFLRFRIIFEVACGLAFLHNSKPEPVVHRDLKPGNILLDRNYVSKIGDVGLAKLVPDVVPESVTVYRDSIIAGTLYYMDPEYQRTGTIRPKSDLYAFGIVILQLLTARHPNGLVFCVEDAMKRNSFWEMLDGSISDWPVAEAEELAKIALQCSQLRCRDRPDLDNEVLPVLKRVLDTADARIKIERDNLHPPSHYFCPILKEIMEDPYIAADGFTYEHRAIKVWLEKHNVSPATKRRLKHTDLTPNHTLRSAIQEWRSRITFSSALISKDD